LDSGTFGFLISIRQKEIDSGTFGLLHDVLRDAG